MSARTSTGAGSGSTTAPDVTRPSPRSMRAPAASSMTSVWSRVGSGSITVVGPSARSPASSRQDFTWALATGSSYSTSRFRPSIRIGGGNVRRSPRSRRPSVRARFPRSGRPGVCGSRRHHSAAEAAVVAGQPAREASAASGVPALPASVGPGCAGPPGPTPSMRNSSGMVSRGSGSTIAPRFAT